VGAWAAGFGLGVLLCAQAPAQTLAGWSTVETQHFRFHFPPEPRANPSAFPPQLEAAFTELRKSFDGALPGKINFYVWNSSEAAEALLGRPLGFANPKHLLIHATADQTRGHELTHVLMHYAAPPDVTTRFISEGTAVAFDLSGRDRLAAARAAVGSQRVAIVGLWATGNATPEAQLYPVAGAFVERLVTRGGRERFLRLLKRQTIEHAREVYGVDLDRIIAEFEADLGGQAAPPNQTGTGPTIEELRAKAQARMRQDRDAFTIEQLREIESLYQSASRSMRTPEGRKILLELTEKYPKANRSGCALLYLAQGTSGGERETFLKKAIDYGDTWYGDGTQVGAYARAQLAAHYAETNRREEAVAMAADVERMFPGAVDHSGARLADRLKALKLLP
jgi:hypothetical protein